MRQYLQLKDTESLMKHNETCDSMKILSEKSDDKTLIQRTVKDKWLIFIQSQGII